MGTGELNAGSSRHTLCRFMLPIPEISARLRGHYIGLNVAYEHALSGMAGGELACRLAAMHPPINSLISGSFLTRDPEDLQVCISRKEVVLITYHFAAIGYTVETQYHSFGSCFPGRRYIKHLLVPDPANKVPEPALFRDVIIAGGDRHRQNITNLQVIMTV